MSTRQLAKSLVPPLLEKFHKGQLGRILVIGGSEDYTGAPYFCSMASALVGADMSHVLCSEGAGPVIKGYSPNLMVHPYLVEGSNTRFNGKLNEKITGLLSRIHVVVIGPGMGRDETMVSQVTEIIRELRKREIPMLIDADGLHLVQNNLELVKHADAVLTPNIVEFGRLLEAANITKSDDVEGDAKQLAQTLGVALLVKGQKDIITDGSSVMHSDLPGSPRRVSGQGDTLSGCIATFLGWRQAYKEKLWDAPKIDADLRLVAAYAGSCVTRLASAKAYKAKGRSMVTVDVTEHVGPAFAELFSDN